MQEMEMPMNLTGYGVYLPYWRLDRAAVGLASGAPVGRGTRSVASYDEDTTSMAVEAARVAMAGSRRRDLEVWFATTAPAYSDKTNATDIHAALDLDSGSAAYDVAGSVRSGAAALRAAADAAAAARPALAVVADIRTGLSGSSDEQQGGDAAAAFVFDPDADPIVQTLATASVTSEFLDRWRIPGDIASKVWEERFGEAAYIPLGERAVSAVLEKAAIVPADVTHFVVAGPHGRAISRIAAITKIEKSAVRDDLRMQIGSAGAAQTGVLLAAALDHAQPGDVICLLTLADGADAALIRATAALVSARPARRVVDLVTDGRADLSYHNFLRWRGLLRSEAPRRPDPDRPAAPPSRRNVGWKFGLKCSRCRNCDTRHLPPMRVCMSCHQIDDMQDERLADVGGVITTYTVDRLAFSAAGPVIAAVIDFDGGGRYVCELTDVDPDDADIGQRVEMAFRRLYTSGGVHDYFWKARPVRSTQSSAKED
jgi:3-hydroxy-3-methylglutaryl CoA synthase/uncharacterized OB-fold protein